jgi:hypothetical protein
VTGGISRRVQLHRVGYLIKGIVGCPTIHENECGTNPGVQELISPNSLRFSGQHWLLLWFAMVMIGQSTAPNHFTVSWNIHVIYGITISNTS